MINEKHSALALPHGHSLISHICAITMSTSSSVMVGLWAEKVRSTRNSTVACVGGWDNG